MTRLVFLDAGPLGLISNPRGGAEAGRCRRWAQGLLEAGVRLFVAEVTDFEVRRELTRLGATAGLRRLDAVKGALEFAPITSAAMLRASALWAEARRRGRPTAGPEALDADVILAAQALMAAVEGGSLVIATENVRHLGLFAEARPWRDIAA
jgi:predicted nucleic acid-binding protein